MQEYKDDEKKGSEELSLKKSQESVAVDKKSTATQPIANKIKQVGITKWKEAPEEERISVPEEREDYSHESYVEDTLQPLRKKIVTNSRLKMVLKFILEIFKIIVPILFK